MLTFTSNCWPQCLLRHHASGAQLLSIPTPPLTVFTLLRTAFGPYSPRLHVVPLPIPQPCTMVRHASQMALHGSSRQCRGPAILAILRGTITYTHMRTITPRAPNAQPAVFPMAREDQLSIVPPTRIHHADGPRMAPLFAVTIGGEPRTKRPTDPRSNEIPDPRLHHVLHLAPHFLCNTIFLDSYLGAKGRAVFWDHHETCGGPHVWEETGTTYRATSAAGLNTTTKFLSKYSAILSSYPRARLLDRALAAGIRSWCKLGA